MITVGLLLAAGASRRFGPTDKLLAPLRGKPLVAHAAEALRALSLDRHLAVITNPALTPHLQGFTLITIPPGGQADSLRAGVLAAGGADRLMITLGDMPDVTPLHLRRVAAATSDQLPACSHDGRTALPPACFPASWLGRLMALQGDQGAGRLMRDLPADQQIAAPGQLGDIDRPGDLPAEG